MYDLSNHYNITFCYSNVYPPEFSTNLKNFMSFQEIFSKSFPTTKFNIVENNNIKEMHATLYDNTSNIILKYDINLDKIIFYKCENFYDLFGSNVDKIITSENFNDHFINTYKDSYETNIYYHIYYIIINALRKIVLNNSSNIE